MKVFFAIGNSSRFKTSLLVREQIDHVLISYADIAGNVDKVSRASSFNHVLIDSGAFSEGKGKAKIAKHQYMDFLEMLPWAYPKVHQKVTGYINLDNMFDAEVTWQNQREFEDKGLRPIPVYHYGEPYSYLEKYVGRYDIVALGGLAIGTVTTAALKKWWDNIAKVYPNQKFHLLGTMQFRAFTDYQPFSIDSITWMAAGIYGRLLTVAQDGGPSRGHLIMPLNEDSQVTTQSLKAGNLQRVNLSRHFFTVEEMYLHNIRAIKYFSKMEWSTKSNTQVDQQVLF